ncbi:MAG: hypothetical protein DI629_18785 [Mesorhizobium amorphae]|nr:MAG: hypothetical protein DI629_18785 [Mesorhizobium amorphae]
MVRKLHLQGPVLAAAVLTAFPAAAGPLVLRSDSGGSMIFVPATPSDRDVLSRMASLPRKAGCAGSPATASGTGLLVVADPDMAGASAAPERVSARTFTLRVTIGEGCSELSGGDLIGVEAVGVSGARIAAVSVGFDVADRSLSASGVAATDARGVTAIRAEAVTADLPDPISGDFSLAWSGASGSFGALFPEAGDRPFSGRGAISRREDGISLDVDMRGVSRTRVVLLSSRSDSGERLVGKAEFSHADEGLADVWELVFGEPPRAALSAALSSAGVPGADAVARSALDGTLRIDYAPAEPAPLRTAVPAMLGAGGVGALISGFFGGPDDG